MKRSWFGLGLLLVLLGMSLFFSIVMTEIHKDVEADLLNAARQAQAGQWEEAEALFYRARDHWKAREHLRASLADHGPTEDADADFAAAEVYCLFREESAFPAACRQLARQTAAVGETHELVWWNFF